MGSYVQLGEVRTYYEEDGDGAPLVLLHPGGADSRAFEVIVPGLAGHFRVFRPDRRGHGLPADKPELFNRLVVDFLTGETDGGDR
jgi:pimeloyl-ACP methyl ester carboxylesterase